MSSEPIKAQKNETTTYAIFTIACPTVAIKSLFSIRHFAVNTCTPKRTYFFIHFCYTEKFTNRFVSNFHPIFN